MQRKGGTRDRALSVADFDPAASILAVGGVNDPKDHYMIILEYIQNIYVMIINDTCNDILCNYICNYM